MALRAFRAVKAGYAVFDGEGARRTDARWHSRGRPVIYCSTCLAGALLEIVAHRGRLRLPGSHHAGIAVIPDTIAREELDPASLPGWDTAPDAPVARAYGDRWLADARTAVLIVPAFTARPLQQHILLNPRHPDFRRIELQPPRPVVWDVRLFGGA